MSESLLATKMRSLRQIRQWTQVELADKSSISRSYVSELERGTREPTVGILKRIADALEVAVETFFDDTSNWPLEDMLRLLPDDLKAFVTEPRAIEYLRIAQLAMSHGVKPETLKDIVRAIK